jgi:putative component of toxin-antitoxin plasmid stabilization module
VEIEHYLSPAGWDPFQRWLNGLRDLRCRAAVLRGYRVYFARPKADRVLLLGGGSKRSQAVDIAAAVANRNAYKERE